ncbi:LytR C-terminal domain-containing protein [Streptomyces sp. 1331.2]|uniref:LytR C-terminal domain-containing protein n=1 Tax=Streptomyces sp. 1331.2 TaxID=1938835 RepID=UPI000BC6B803|nr:LytR C-terminal domain-containing protein [Streptomyces sp. 1331.2]SOB83082.1 LytR cell envelope-related transcriptional attenuator [Streptomyces sp. 1331.2]
MSMLTPQGLKGKQYRITGNSYPRLGRPPKRSRKVIAALAGLLALALVALGGVQLYDIFTGRNKNASAQACAAPSGKPLAAPTGGATPGAPGAPAASGAPAAAQGDPHAIPQPATITVNVYNATTKAGLAGRTAEELKKRGFTIGKVGNAPAELDKKVPGTAQVIAGPAGAGAGTLVGSQIAGAAVTADARTDASVDFVIGDSYNALLDETQAAAALALATKPSPTPTAPGSC